MAKFDEDGLPMATNHAGWDVQVMTYDGWETINHRAIESKSAAREWRDELLEINPGQEFRIYEALTA